jgi:hypothetical protein
MREENSKKRDCPDPQSAPLQSQKRHEADAIWPQEDGDHRSVEKIAEGDKSEWSKGGLYRSMVEAALAEWKAEGEADEEVDIGSDDEDGRAKYSKFRRFWISLWSDVFGSFDDISEFSITRLHLSS